VSNITVSLASRMDGQRLNLDKTAVGSEASSLSFLHNSHGMRSRSPGSSIEPSPYAIASMAD